LDKKQRLLLEAYNEDLRTVEELFHAHKAKPRIDSNLPPIAGSLWWCRGLFERVSEPMEKLRALGSAATRHEMKDIEKVYDAFNRSLGEYEKKNLALWTNEIERTSQEKLKMPLLRRNDEMLAANFDEALVRLLREVKYFLLLGIEVPPAARTIYEKAETYRKQVCVVLCSPACLPACLFVSRR
jgi:dynein heavy chain